MTGRPAKPYPKHKQLANERKPYRRTVASRKTWERLVDEKLGPCRVCGDPASNGRYFGRIQLHHVVPRDRWGDDTADNLVPVCPDCHGGIHNRNRAHVLTLLSRLTDAEYSYAVDKFGEAVFEQVYGIEYQRV